MGTPIEAVNSGARPELLWSNPNLSENVKTLEVPLDLKDYTWILVQSVSSTTTQNINPANLLEVGEPGLCVSYLGNARYRKFTTSQTGVNFENGMVGTSVTTSICIPYKIYGIRW